MKKYIILATIGAVLGLGYCFLAYFLMGFGQPSSLGADLIPIDLQLKVPKEQVLTNEIKPDLRCDDVSRECVDHGEMIKYSYVTNNEVSQFQGDTVLTPDIKAKYATRELQENLSKRKHNSITFDLPDGKEATVFFNGTQYAKEVSTGKWFNVEVATTTIEAFDTQTKVSVLDKIKLAFIGKVYATESPFYPDPHTESTSVDGFAYNNTHNTWTQKRDTGVAAADTGEGGGTGAAGPIYLGADSSAWENMYKSVYVFDTSAIDPDEVESATFSVYGTGKADVQSNAPTFVLREYTGSSETSLVKEDYDLVNNDYITRFATDITYASWSTAGYNDMALNQDGLDNISTTGLSKFSVTTDYDFDNTEPTGSGSNNLVWRFNAWYSEKEGTDYDPKLVVVYSAAAAGINQSYKIIEE